MSTRQIRLEDLRTVKDFAVEFSNVVNEHSLRYQLRNRDLNGLAESGAVVERGERLYLVVPKYLDWFLQGNHNAA